MNRIRRRMLTLSLAFVFCLSLLPTSLAAENRTVTIRNVRDLLDLSRQCTSDTWSQGVTVVLASDISLEGFDFSPIPVFSGTFDGAGYKITGLSITKSGSDQGLFRYLQPDALVSNLVLSGSLTPGGTKTGVGLLAGRNEGTISRCTVSGTVIGAGDVGGMVGLNTASGKILDCTSGADVTGNQDTGGIAGRNEGYIRGCTNQGTVNGAANESAQNTGGIAGQSTGSIIGCRSDGSIGYPHTGYNTGGLVGLQSGNVVGCENHGSVYGRKDIGGIVGQFEPYTVLSYGDDPIAMLNDELAVLSGLMTALADQISAVTGTAVTDFSAINGSLSDLQDTMHAAGTEGGADFQAASGQIYTSAQAINGALGTLLTQLDAFSTVANNDLSEITAALSELRGGLSSAADAISWGVSTAQVNVDSGIRGIALESDGIAAEISQLSAELQRLEGFLRDVLDAAEQMDMAAIQASYERWDIASIDLGGHISRIAAHIRNMGADLKGLWNGLSYALESTSEAVSDALARVNTAGKRLETAINHLNTAANTFSSQATSLLKIVNQSMREIEDSLKAYLDAVGEKGRARLDEIDRELEQISGTIDAMTAGAGAANTDIHQTTTDIIHQLDAIRAAIQKATAGPQKTLEDASDAAEQDGALGRVAACKNTAGIQGDANVGGIAGIVSPEISLDPEQDLDLAENKLLVDTVATMKATIRSCENTGEITAKTGCAGGILGRAEMGAVLDCVSRCTVSASDGPQCGGIAGLSRAVIRRCAAQCDLAGQSSLGGIAGEGRDILDCRAMARIQSAGEKQGAIAGFADGTVEGNYFLAEDIAGMDGINFSGRTTPLSFAAFAAMDGVPASFLTFTVTFRAGDTDVAIIEVPYSGCVDPSSFPAVPPSGGRFGQWSSFNAAHITRSVVVVALYSDWVTTISSPEAKPYLLAEGAFSPAAQLHLSEYAGTDSLLSSDYTVIAAYDYQITDKESLPDTVTLRLLAAGVSGAPQAALLQDGALTLLDAKQDGSYLVFSGRTEGTLVLLSRGTAAHHLGILLGGGASIAALVLLALQLHRRKPPAKTQPQDMPVS